MQRHGDAEEPVQGGCTHAVSPTRAAVRSAAQLISLAMQAFAEVLRRDAVASVDARDSWICG